MLVAVLSALGLVGWMRSARTHSREALAIPLAPAGAPPSPIMGANRSPIIE